MELGICFAAHSYTRHASPPLCEQHGKQQATLECAGTPTPSFTLLPASIVETTIKGQQWSTTHRTWLPWPSSSSVPPHELHQGCLPVPTTHPAHITTTTTAHTVRAAARTPGL